jgi:hypothetical protein
LLAILPTTLIQDNKNAILATHSPAVIMEGWFDKVSEVSDLVTIKSKSGLHAA